MYFDFVLFLLYYRAQVTSEYDDIVKTEVKFEKSWIYANWTEF